MPSNRTPRGGKPTSGSKSAPGGARGGAGASGPRKGSSGGRSASAGGPGRSSSAGGPGRSSGSGFGRSASGGTRSEGKFGRGAQAEGTQWGDRPARAGKSEFGRTERPDRPSRGGKPDAGRPARGRTEGPARGRSEGPRTERPTRAPREEKPRLVAPPEAIENDEQDNAPSYAEGVGDIVFGRHPVLAVLQGDAPVNKVWVLRTLTNRELVNNVKQLAKEKGASVQMVDRPKLDALTLDANHQGLVVSVAAADYVELEEVIAAAKAKPYPALLMLDGIEDPHNLGALIRTAEGAGFAGVIIPARRAVGLTPTVHKASAGAVARVPVARVGNLAQAVSTLHDAGFWLAGANARGEKLPYEIDMTVPIVIVVGAEGKGLSKLLGDKCDWLVHLELGGELESLNASVAGGVLMYEAVRQRWAKGDVPGPETAGG